MQLLAFIGVVQLAAMSPGPDFVLVTRHAALSGRRAGVSAALGIACGVFAWAVVAAFGVAALLAASAVAFSIVKLAGAAYLAYLGVKSLRAAIRGGSAALAEARSRTVSSWVAFRQGLVTNLLNPKAARSSGSAPSPRSSARCAAYSPPPASAALSTPSPAPS